MRSLWATFSFLSIFVFASAGLIASAGGGIQPAATAQKPYQLQSAVIYGEGSHWSQGYAGGNISWHGALMPKIIGGHYDFIVEVDGKPPYHFRLQPKPVTEIDVMNCGSSVCLNVWYDTPPSDVDPRGKLQGVPKASYLHML